MRELAKGVKTAVYKKTGVLNVVQTVFVTMATVALWYEEEQAFYTFKEDAYQLLIDQRLLTYITNPAFNQAFRDRKAQGKIKRVGLTRDCYRWLVDPREFSAVEADREAFRKEQEK